MNENREPSPFESPNRFGDYNIPEDKNKSATYIAKPVAPKEESKGETEYERGYSDGRNGLFTADLTARLSEREKELEEKRQYNRELSTAFQTSQNALKQKLETIAQLEKRIKELEGQLKLCNIGLTPKDTVQCAEKYFGMGKVDPEQKQETADKEKQYLFPKASDEAKKAGWTHSTAFMDDIQNYVDDHGESISPEAIEYVLEYLEATHVESTPSDQEELLTELWELAQHKFNCQQFLKEAKEKYRIERNS